MLFMTISDKRKQLKIRLHLVIRMRLGLQVFYSNVMQSKAIWQLLFFYVDAEN